jgi:hypothetical protein
MIKLKDILILTEAKSMMGVTIGDKFINRSNKRELEVIDFYVTKNIKGKVVESVVLAIDSMKVTSRHPFSSVVRGKI